MAKKYLLCLVCIIAIALTGCGRSGGRKEKQETIPVKVMKIELRDLERVIEYVGTIRGKDEAVVYPKVSGKIIEKVKDEGSPVEKGEVIAYIDRDEVGLTFEKAPVESPLAGVVGRVYVDIGSNVNPETPVALVVDMEGVKTELQIPERYTADISLGEKALISVDAYPRERFTGTITKISPVLDVETRSSPIEITIRDENRLLKSGMFAKVKLIIEERPGVPVILKEAIIGKVPDTYVYVIANNKAIMRKISLGIRQGPYFEVTNGLAVGDRVVVMGQQRLRDGSPVSVESEQETSENVL